MIKGSIVRAAISYIYDNLKECLCVLAIIIPDTSTVDSR